MQVFVPLERRDVMKHLPGAVSTFTPEQMEVWLERAAAGTIMDYPMGVENLRRDVPMLPKPASRGTLARYNDLVSQRIRGPQGGRQ